MSNKIRQLEDNLAFRYVADSDKTTTWQQKNITPPTGKLPSQNLQDTYKDIGAVLEFLRGGGGEIYNEKGDVIAYGGSAPDLSFSPLFTKGALKKIRNFIKYTPKKFQTWAKETKPTKSIETSIDYAKESARKNIYSLKGFDRFLNTVEGGDKVKNAPIAQKMNLYKAWKNLIKDRIEGAEIRKMSRLEMRDDPNKRGYAIHGEGQGIISLRPTGNLPKGMPKDNPSLFPLQTSTAVHEVTHMGQLNVAKNKTGLELDRIADQYGVHRNDMKWLVNKLDGADSRWELGYMEKIKPYLKKGFNITDPNVGQKIPKDMPGHWVEYALQPREISARMSQIRDLQNKTNPTSMEKRLLKHMKSVESKFFDKKGIDYAVDKLWMAAPITIGLNEELFKEIME